MTIRKRDLRVKDFGETEKTFLQGRIRQGVSRQKEMLGHPVQHFGSFHLCFEKRDDRSHPVPENLPDFLHVFFLHPDAVTDELHGLCSDMVVFPNLLPEILLIFFDAPVR